MASKSNGLEPSDWARAPVASGPVWQRFLKVIYNPEEKSFFGRTAKRWGIVLTFYLVFYVVLAAMFAVCMGGLFYTLDDKIPKFTLKQSLIGANPGVNFRPRPSDGTQMRLNLANSSSYEGYITELEDFLKPYATEGWPSCSTNDNFGYPDAPCFIIKLNKIYGWEPQYYTDAASVPADMPADLVEYIKGVDHPAKHKQIWVSCTEEGSNRTVLEYPWGRGLSGLAYPYRNQPGYQSPLVAVRVVPPVNNQVNIRCRAWAKNIIHNKSIKEASGYTRIMLYIEDHASTDEAGAAN